jgi:hypothetical protein
MTAHPRSSFRSYVAKRFVRDGSVPNRLVTNAGGLLAATLLLAATPACFAGTPQPPDWVLAAAHATLPSYPASTKAVVVNEEEILTVGADGRAIRHQRRAIRILRQQGRVYGTVVVPINKDEKIRSLRVWSIAADGHPYTLNDKEIIEVGNDEYGILYNDLHLRVGRPPAVDPGSTIAYEYEQTTRPYRQEFTWSYQDEIPKLHSAFELDLPADWKYSAAVRTGASIQATQPGPGRYRWQIDNVAAVDIEDIPMTPSAGALEARMSVHYAQQAEPTGDARWTAVGSWFSSLETPQAQATPEIAAKAQALVAGQTDFTDKVESVASYLQRKIRYVGIEIGIGGWQPHSAGDIFRYQYGDCKDKATLLRAMLESVSIHATLVSVDTHRGFIDPQIPSMYANHAIAAIEIPAGYSNPVLQSVVTLSDGKRYLIFDPTDPWTPIGQIRPDLQGGYGVISLGAQSQLIQLPRLTPEQDRTEHVVHAQLMADGSLEAAVVEQRFGYAAVMPRAAFAEGSEQQQRDFLEKRLHQDLRSVALDKIAAPHPTDLVHPFEIDYSFHAPGYARSVGNMLLVRPRILGTDTLPLPREPRNWPIDLGAIQTRRETIDLALPAGYVVDELPEAVTLDTDFASYRSSVTAEGATLHYTREYTVKKLELEAARYDELRKFHERIAYDEATTAVLKKQ